MALPKEDGVPPAPVPRKLRVAQQVAKLMTLLQRIPSEKATPALYQEIVGWVNDIPTEQRPESLGAAIAQAFGKPIEEVDAVVRPADRRAEFDPLVPRDGWLHDYIEWTRQTEPPTVFHFFVAAATVGAALGRSVWFDKGAYSVFPNLCVVLVAPTGRCRKTSACGVGVGLLSRVGGTVLADKTTPEALVDALRANANAVGLLYAPELAVFLGKQKYQEGMVPLLTSLFDCPKEWTSKTIGRGETVLTNVALSALMCSTLDWIQTGIPKDAFGGGFMSRFLFVVQESTSRSFPLPPPLREDVRRDLVSRLIRLRKVTGEFHFTDEAREWYVRWYKSRAGTYGNKQYAGYYERRPDHVIRLAMVLRTAGAGGLTLDAEDLQAAERILRWVEVWLPSTFEEMTASPAGEDQSRILRHLRAAGGSMEHSELLRRQSSRMNAEHFKKAMATLREAKLVEWDPVARTYYLTREGWQ